MVKRLLFAIICLAAPLALGQGAVFDGTAQSVVSIGSHENLVITVPRATITVYQYKTSTAATLCTDVTCATNASNNVVTADGYGNFTFFALAGSYTYAVSGKGIITELFNITRGSGSGVTVSPNQVVFSNSSGILSGHPGLKYMPLTSDDLLIVGDYYDPSGRSGVLCIVNLPGTFQSCLGTDRALSNIVLLPPSVPNATVAISASLPLALDSTTGNLSIGTQYTKLRCETGLGDGLNAMTAGTYLQSFCYNDSGVTWTITGIKCYVDGGSSSTLNAEGNTLGALLTGPITCSTAFATTTQSANVLLTSGDYIKFTFVADGTAKQTTWVVSMTQ